MRHDEALLTGCGAIGRPNPSTSRRATNPACASRPGHGVSTFAQPLQMLRTEIGSFVEWAGALLSWSAYAERPGAARGSTATAIFIRS